MLRKILTYIYQFCVLGWRGCDDHVQLVVNLGRDCWDGNTYAVIGVLVVLIVGVVHNILVVADLSEVSTVVPESKSQQNSYKRCKYCEKLRMYYIFVQ